jgi:hypothetical protein
VFFNGPRMRVGSQPVDVVYSDIQAAAFRVCTSGQMHSTRAERGKMPPHVPIILRVLMCSSLQSSGRRFLDATHNEAPLSIETHQFNRYTNDCIDAMYTPA